MNISEPWGQLISTSGVVEERIPIIGETFTIGRRSSCDLIIPNNHHVSSNHCVLTHDKDGTVWLSDSSTNGTLVDGTKVKNNKVKLKNSSVIQIVFNNIDAKSNITYHFVSLSGQVDDSLNVTQYEDKFKLDQGLGCSKYLKDTNTKSLEVQPSVSNENKAELVKEDSIEDTLICQICQEILHDCVRYFNF
jgi:E3 ubiquitin-protein ligase CHFR